MLIIKNVNNKINDEIIQINKSILFKIKFNKN